MLILFAAFAGGAGYYAMDLALDPGTPMKVNAVVPLTPVVHPGDEVQFQYAISRNRRCPNIIIGFIVDPLTNEAVLRFDPVFGGYGAIGENVSTLVRRQAPVREGRFCYRATFTHWCGDRTYTSDEPDACFEVRK
jgi:hypothetical protein